MGRTLSSALILSTIGLGSKAVIKFLARRFDVRGLPILLNALKEPDLELSWRKGKEKAAKVGTPEEPRRRRGIVTICNHNSVVDDPLMWSMLPSSHYLPLAGPSRVSRMNRWTLGASDIMFTNRWFSRFFNNGQVIETIRGGGIFQPAVDKAIKLLQDGEWIHVFPEGKISQITINPPGGMIRFKWGVGRIIMDSETMPEIIPIWISRFDTIMPETRGWPRAVPRRGGDVSITIGESLTPKIQPLVDEWRALAGTQTGTVGIGGNWEERDGSPPGDHQKSVRQAGDLAEGKERDIRLRICEALQDSVRELGEAVERAEGRFDRGEWSNSRRHVGSEGQGKMPDDKGQK